MKSQPKFEEAAFAKECAERFDLSYHVPYAFECARKVSFAGKDVLEVGGSLPPRFVSEVLGARSWTAIETPTYEVSLAEADGLTHKGTLLHRDSEVTPVQGFGQPLAAPYSFFLTTIEELPPAHHARYDLVFSIATFEHIHKLPLALDRMHKALKPGGQLFSLFAPVWSAYDGHHLPGISDGSGRPVDRTIIPPWGHLLKSPPEMLRYLSGKTDFETAALMVYYIYQAPSINRLFTEDYVGYIQQTPFRVLGLNGVFLVPVPPEAQRALGSRYPGRTRFDNNGLYVLLQK